MLFQNLIGNAIKYHRAEEAPRVQISASRGVKEWLFKVEDDGIGIDPQYHNRIFGVFKRLNPATYPGTGIGLALCERAVEATADEFGWNPNWARAPGSFLRFRTCRRAGANRQLAARQHESKPTEELKYKRLPAAPADVTPFETAASGGI